MTALSHHMADADRHWPLPMQHAAEILAPVRRWTAHRKEQLLRAIATGIVTEQQVCDAHRVDADEIAMWRAELSQTGISGLRVCQGIRSGRRAAQKRGPMSEASDSPSPSISPPSDPPTAAQAA